jgi:methyltransferase (TIGR00027 family)
MTQAPSASKTARYVALFRALETIERRRPALFQDPYATKFLSMPLRAAVASARTGWLQTQIARYADARAPGARTSVIGRTAFIDDAVRAARSRGVEQYVLLGAGFDCRAQRLPELATARVFEVDRAATQAQKRAVLGSTPTRYVSVDFLKDDAFARLAEHGWNRGAPSLFIWEGVTSYLDEAAVLRVLHDVSRCAVGTSIVFTYIHRGVIDRSVSFEGADTVARSVQGMREPWTFGIVPEELAAFLARTGLTLREELGADDYRARYLPAWENWQGYRFYRLAVAEVAAHVTP